jgi:hypothetical protein
MVGIDSVSFFSSPMGNSELRRGLRLSLVSAEDTEGKEAAKDNGVPKKRKRGGE